MHSDYKQKVIKAVSLAGKISEIEYIEEKIRTTEEINRRTKAGQELTQELLNLCSKKALQLTSNEEPF